MTSRLTPVEVEVDHLQRRLIHMGNKKRDALLGRLLAPFGVFMPRGPLGPPVATKQHRKQMAKRLEAWKQERELVCRSRATQKR